MIKRAAALICMGSLAVALTAWGAPKAKQVTRPSRTIPAARVSAAHVSHGSVSDARGRGHALVRAKVPRRADVGTRSGLRIQKRRTVSARTAGRFQSVLSRQRTLAHGRSAYRRSALAGAKKFQPSRPRAGKARIAAAINKSGNLREKKFAGGRGNRPFSKIGGEQIARASRATAWRDLSRNRQRNLTFARNVLYNRAADARITNYWRTDRFRDPRYAAFYHYQRQWHDRDWWRRHHTRIIFVLGGWWYWDAGYWYPCWGYDPYAWYWYDGPIYTGYASLTPDQVIINVQLVLRGEGYYAGAIDGILGPQTRAALAAFQADHGLAVTSAVDQPTLQTMGLA